MRLFIAALALTAAAIPALADSAGTKTVQMPFAECQSIIGEIAGEIDAAPVDLVSTGDLRTARIGAADGFVTVSCDRTAGTMSLSKSSRTAAATVTASR